MLVSYATDRGLVREQNEDSYLVYAQQVFAVADGMGGHAAGEVASQTIVATLQQAMGHSSLKEEDLVQLVKNANGEIFKNASQHEEYAGMGSTISLMAVRDEVLTWVHVGDSRIYRLRDGKLEQITTDHSFINEIKAAYQEEIPPEVKNSKSKNILTRAVGVAFNLKVDSGVEKIKPGDKYLLCTDGLTNMVPLEEIKDLCQSQAVDKAQALVHRALAYGGKDNVTCIVVEIND